MSLTMIYRRRLRFRVCISRKTKHSFEIRERRNVTSSFSATHRSTASRACLPTPHFLYLCHYSFLAGHPANLECGTPCETSYAGDIWPMTSTQLYGTAAFAHRAIRTESANSSYKCSSQKALSNMIVWTYLTLYRRRNKGINS